MLWNKNWDVKTKADPFTLEGLIAWLEMHPAGRQYDYCDRETCLIAEYLKAQGVKNYNLRSYEIPPQFVAVVHPFAIRHDDWTFGAALSRARAALAAS